MCRLGRFLFAVTTGTLFLACGEPVRRHVELTVEDGLPSARSLLVGDSLQVEVTRMESFRAGTELTVWARTGQVFARLGVVVPGSSTRFGAQPVSWSAVVEVLLTEEASTPAPAMPSAAVVFRGAPGGPLTFVDAEALTVKRFAAAHVAADLEDQALQLTSLGLPSLGPGRSYALWLFKDEITGEKHEHVDHSHTTEQGHADEPVWPSPTWLGTLGVTGKDAFIGEELLATYDELVLTIEFDRGSPAMGSVIMRGEIPTGVGVTEAAPGAHTLEGHAH